MIYIEKDDSGSIRRVAPEPFEGMTGSMEGGEEDVAAWLAREDVRSRLHRLKESDLELVRVIEDLVNLLVSKGLIRYTDLPDAARHKLQAREADRTRLNELSSLLGDDDQLML